jgi:peptidoglycan hydrolase CwlO-like protein
MLELSYVRSASVHRRPSQTLYPTALDYPNLQGKDKLLWFYPFLPTLLSQESFAACAERAERLHSLESATKGAVRDSEYSPALRQQIERLTEVMRHSESDRESLRRQIEALASDREALQQQIERLTEVMRHSESDRESLRQQIEALASDRGALRQQIEALLSRRAFRWLARFANWPESKKLSELWREP